jgi:hypothetical protein
MRLERLRRKTKTSWEKQVSGRYSKLECAEYNQILSLLATEAYYFRGNPMVAMWKIYKIMKLT